MNILFVAAHVDDIELGAAGFLSKMIDKANCRVIIFSDCEEQPGNKGITEEFFKSMETLGVKDYVLHHFTNTRFPQEAHEIRKVLDNEKITFNPDIVVTHYNETFHQDHKTVSEECIRVFRTSSILMYEDMKSVENFAPNLIVSLTREQLDKKKAALRCYETQSKRYYCDPNLIESLAHVRGKQMNVEFGEAFKVHRFIYK